MRFVELRNGYSGLLRQIYGTLVHVNIFDVGVGEKCRILLQPLPLGNKPARKDLLPLLNTIANTGIRLIFFIITYLLVLIIFLVQ